MNKTLRLCALLALWSATASAIVIDDFSIGPITLISEADPVTFTQSGLDSAHVVGGKRHFDLAASGSDGQFVSIGDDLITLGFDDAGPATRLAYLSLTYGSDSEPLSLDLTTGGNDRFFFDDADGLPPAGWLRIRSDSGQSVLRLGELVDAPYLLFSEFSEGADFSSITTIEIDAIRSRGFTFGAIRVVPEPDSIAISLILLAVLFTTQRRRLAT